MKLISFVCRYNIQYNIVSIHLCYMQYLHKILEYFTTIISTPLFSHCDHPSFGYESGASLSPTVIIFKLFLVEYLIKIHA